MRAHEIADKVSLALKSDKFKFLRCNFANGDMVGHTGLIPATVSAVKTLDEVVGRLVSEVHALKGWSIITADHGNCEEKLDEKGKMKTSHTLNKVPFILVAPDGWSRNFQVDATRVEQPAGLTNVAATILNLLGFEKPGQYRESLISFS